MRLLLPALLLLSASAAGARPTKLTIPLTILVARCGRSDVRPSGWVDAHLAGAAKVLSPHRIALSAQRQRFAPARCKLATRADRDALAAHLDPAAEAGIPVLVVEEMLDLDLPGYRLMGVHWRYRGPDPRYRGRRYVILTARAKPPVLAHELAHYLGLPHDPAGGNLMTPGPSAPIWRQPGRKPEPFSPTLSDEQARRIRRAVQALPRRRP